MAFTKIAAAGIGSTGTVTLQNIIVTGSVNTPSITGAASTENVKTNSLVVSGVTTSSGGFVGNVTGNATGLSGTPNITVGSIIASSATISGNVSVAGTVTYEDVTNVDSVGVITARSDIIVGAGLSVVGVTTLASAGGITTAGGTLFAKQLNISGVSTFGNTVVGGATTQLLVNGNTRITGILTVGTSSLTFDGNSNVITGLSTIAGSSNLAKPNLAGISSTISSTAVDVFVYDTRKDSDGGQWRKRTQHTSWYNETLNTATRGSRRDFPAVAVIVATTSSVTIYDGDDPDMPMWMVFNQGSSQGNNFMLNRFMGNIKAISMLNGNLFVSINSTSSADRGGTLWVNFISEISYASGTEDVQSENIYGFLRHNIAQRNTVLGSNVYGDKSSKYQLVNNSQCNDVAMTVLPNAPIDNATGLPVPTIAVATDGGVSVIKDDGNVWDIVDNTADYRKNLLINFTTDNKIVYTEQRNSADEYGWMYVHDIPSADTTITVNTQSSALSWFDTRTISYMDNNLNGGVDGHINNITRTSDGVGTPLYRLVAGNNRIYVAPKNSNGLTIIEENRGSNRSGLVAYATTSYNTGWMHGDIKGAWLSDTSTASVTGTELVTNGTFTSNVTGWSTQANATLTWDAGSGGQAKVVTSASSNTGIYQTVSGLTIGQKYAVFCAINAPSGTINLAVYTDTGFGTLISNVNGTGNNAYQTLSLIFTATTTSVVIITGVSAAVTSYRDNISLRLLSEPDRSVNNNGLAVYGTITKSAVATGSNLVAYSGFNTTTNYLEQPYNSSLSFGTGDFSVTCWYYNNTGTEIRVQRTTGGANGWAITLGNAGGDLYIHNGDFSTFASFAGLSNTGVWNHFTFVRRYNDKWYIYKNGVLSGTTTTLSGTNFNDTGTFKVHASSGNSPNSIALLRVSSTVPSPTQIAKIYNDEKALFQPNSQCTLYGSSDAVTALAYDDTTKLLSVGTSSGRSDFQGLERINNTTTAVTTAISASNGLIAEQ